MPYTRNAYNKTNIASASYLTCTGDTAGYRYGYGSHEKIDEIAGSGNYYDMGARLYDPRIGRTPTLDPEKALYPSISPYAFVANMPTVAIDPDGRYIIFINGEVGQFGSIGKSNSKDRASVSYWTQAFVDKVTGAFGDKKYTFRDGDQGMSASTRKEVGAAHAKSDFKDIISQLEKNKDGKIIETMKIVSHSKGSAYAAGYIEAWNELRNSNEYKDLFAGEGGTVEFSLMLAAHQGMNFSLNNPSGTNVNIHHQWDDMSWSDVKGDVLNIETDNNQWIWESWETHTIDGFHFEAEDVINKYMQNKASGASSTTGIKDAAKNASKQFYDRKTKTYVDDM